VADRPGQQGGPVARVHPFTQVTDQRNAEPVVRILPAAPEVQILAGSDSSEMYLDAEDFAPRAHLEGGGGIQPCRLAVIGEKSSLEPVLGPVADEFRPICTCRPARSATRSCTGCQPSNGP
jgi:hypothetical protein